MTTDEMNTALAATLAALPGVTAVERRGDGLWVEAPELDVAVMGQTLHWLGLRLGVITGIPRAGSGETTILYHYLARDGFINIRTVTRNGALPSLAPIAQPASWAEREITDLFGVTFTGHPDPRPLLRPPGSEEGMLREAMCALQRPAPASQV